MAQMQSRIAPLIYSFSGTTKFMSETSFLVSVPHLRLPCFSFFRRQFLMLKPFLVFQSLILVNIPLSVVPSQDFCAIISEHDATDDAFVQVHRGRPSTAVVVFSCQMSLLLYWFYCWMMFPSSKPIATNSFNQSALLLVCNGTSAFPRHLVATLHSLQFASR